MSIEKIDIEEMGNFFNLRADGYEDHMKNTVKSFDKYYELISHPMKYTKERISILDLGCGTGLEIEYILKKAPNAEITCIDLSKGMLNILEKKYKDNKNQINIINESYLEYPFNKCKYDYIFSVMTMHHFLYDEKLNLYKKIKQSLKTNGMYIEGDYVVDEEHEEFCLERREALLKDIKYDKSKIYHIDIPFSFKTQKKLFKEAGFNDFNMFFSQGEHQIYTVK